MNEGTTLAIATTTGTGSVALARAGRAIARIEVETRSAVSDVIVALVRDAMHHVGVSPPQIERIVAARGPGSFTGIRVGLATGRALALGWGRSFRTVTAFEAVAARFQGRRVCVVLDARRGQVYAARVPASGSGHDPVALDPESLEAWGRVAGPFDLVAGTALVAHEDVIAAAFPGVELALGVEPDALGVALADAAGWSVEAVEPLYVRPPDARLPREGGS